MLNVYHYKVNNLLYLYLYFNYEQPHQDYLKDIMQYQCRKQIILGKTKKIDRILSTTKDELSSQWIEKH